MTRLKPVMTCKKCGHVYDATRSEDCPWLVEDLVESWAMVGAVILVAAVLWVTGR